MPDPDQIRALAAGIRPADLRRSVEMLPAPRAVGDPGREQIAELIEQRFHTLGWEVRRQKFRSLIGAGCNVIASRTGSDRPESRCTVGAHYDTVAGSPGADDNGSAVAGLLAIAAALSSVTFSATVELVAFDQEEYGFLGSHAYVEALLADIGTSTHPPLSFTGALILEMIGYCSSEPNSQKIPVGFDYLYPDQIRTIASRESRGEFLALVSNRDSRMLATRVTDAFRLAAPGLPVIGVEAPEGPVRPPVMYLSDHVPFWSAGLPAIQLTDTAFLRNPNYHLASDTPDTLDYPFAAAVTQGTLAALCSLAV